MFAMAASLPWAERALALDSQKAPAEQRNELRQNDPLFAATIEQVIADDKTIDFGEKIELAPGKQRIEFHYAVSGLVAPEKSQQFKYKLEGYDNDWIDAGARRVAYYTRVPAGQYRFRVLACDKDGTCSESGASINFIIRPYFYQTYWFYAACAVCFALIGAAAFRLRVRQMRARERKLVQLVLERTRQLEEANQNLQRLSYLDGLTGISNRRQFEEILGVEWRRACRSSVPLSLIMIDIDYFKSYNDTYGHQRGDDCLKRVAEALNDSLKRAGDMVARYGGEEFAVILPEVNAKEAAEMAEILRECVEALEIPHETPSGCVLTISVGVATVYPEKDMSVISLLSSADQALYRAKYEGRNQVLISDTIHFLNPF